MKSNIYRILETKISTRKLQANGEKGLIDCHSMHQIKRENIATLEGLVQGYKTRY